MCSFCVAQYLQGCLLSLPVLNEAMRPPQGISCNMWLKLINATMFITILKN